MNVVQNLISIWQMIIESIQNKICCFFYLPHDITYKPTIHQSPINSTTLFIIRLCALIYLTAIFIWNMLLSSTVLVNIVFLTMWGYFFTWLYFLLTIQHYILYEYKSSPTLQKQKQTMKYYVELVYQFAFDSQLPITIVFWSILFYPLLGMQGITVQIIALNCNLHAGPIILLLLQLPFNSCRFHYRHFMIVMILGFTYLLINMFYSVFVTPVYPQINWVTVSSYVICLLAIIFAFLMHLFGHLIYAKCKQQVLEDSRYDKMHEQNIQVSQISEKYQTNQILTNQQNDKKSRSQTYQSKFANTN